MFFTHRGQPQQYILHYCMLYTLMVGPTNELHLVSRIDKSSSCQTWQAAKLDIQKLALEDHVCLYSKSYGYSS